MLRLHETSRECHGTNTSGSQHFRSIIMTCAIPLKCSVQSGHYLQYLGWKLRQIKQTAEGEECLLGRDAVQSGTIVAMYQIICRSIYTVILSVYFKNLSNQQAVLQVGGFDVPLETALCKNLPAENTQRYLSRPKPTMVAVPIEEEVISRHVSDTT